MTENSLGKDLPNISRLAEQPTFDDGELDLWPDCQVGLQRFDSLPNVEYAKQVNRIETNRNIFIGLLTGYASQIGCSFTVTLPEHVNVVYGGSNDIWAHSIDYDVVQIPRYVLERRPKGKDYVSFRNEVPTAHILVNMAHELSHLERRRNYPEIYEQMFKDKSPRGERYKVNFTSEIREEEILTDEHCFQLLKKMRIPITPETFVAQIPRNDAMPNYRQETILRLR